MTSDPTFTLGDFDVTVITYRHLLLETCRGMNSPILLGPILIHYKKNFASYLFFTSSLVGLCPNLQMVRAFGTDGEKALSDTFSHEFTLFQHLTCSIHVRRNITQKLQECNISSETSKKS